MIVWMKGSVARGRGRRPGGIPTRETVLKEGNSWFIIVLFFELHLLMMKSTVIFTVYYFYYRDFLKNLFSFKIISYPKA